MATQKTRKKIISAFLGLVADEGWNGFEMSDLAEAAGVKLSVLRAEFPSRTACFKAFAAQIDETVLDGIDADMADEPGRDRLFDVLMARLDALSPHREAVRGIQTAAMSDPGLALRLNGIATTSMRWMLTAAGLPATGRRAGMIAQGLVVAFSRVVDVWLDDDDPGLARTMAALDKQLDVGEVWLGRVDRLGSILKPLMSFAGKRSSRRKGADTGESDIGSTVVDDKGTSPTSA